MLDAVAFKIFANRKKLFIEKSSHQIIDHFNFLWIIDYLNMAEPPPRGTKLSQLCSHYRKFGQDEDRHSFTGVCCVLLVQRHNDTIPTITLYTIN